MCHLDVVPDHICQWSSPNPFYKLEGQHFVLYRFCPVVLINLLCIEVICALLLHLLLMLVLQHRCAVDTSNVVGLGATFHCLNMNALSLRFFATRIEIWLPMSGVLMLTKPQGFLIMSQIVMMSSSKMLVYGKSISWPSSSFWATTWLNPDLRNISSISSMMVGGRLSAAGTYLPSITVATSSSFFFFFFFFFFLSASLRDSSSSLTWWSSPYGCLGTFWYLSHCHPHVVS